MGSDGNIGIGKTNPASKLDINGTVTTNALLARAHDTDFMLLSLEGDPVENSNIKPYYLGWDRTGVPVPSSFCIHHPIKLAIKYAYSECPTITNRWQIEWRGQSAGIIDLSPPYTHWVVYFTEYSTAGGSSGSPLLDGDYKRVIGQCHGAPRKNGCPPDTIPEIVYGRFDLSWNGNSSSERLSDWLDPINSGNTVIDGMQPIPYLCEYNLELSGTITATNDYHAVRRITSTQIINSGATSYKAGASITLQPNFHAKAGSIFSAQIEECGVSANKFNSQNNNSAGASTEYYTNNTHIQTQSKAQVTLFPNPNSGAFQIETNFPYSAIANLKITNMLGVSVYETQHLVSNEILLQNAGAGLYFVVVLLEDGTVVTQKMVVQR